MANTTYVAVPKTPGRGHVTYNETRSDYGASRVHPNDDNAGRTMNLSQFSRSASAPHTQNESGISPRRVSADPPIINIFPPSSTFYQSPRTNENSKLRKSLEEKHEHFMSSNTQPLTPPRPPWRHYIPPITEDLNASPLPPQSPHINNWDNQKLTAPIYSSPYNFIELPNKGYRSPSRPKYNNTGYPYNFTDSHYKAELDSFDQEAYPLGFCPYKLNYSKAEPSDEANNRRILEYFEKKVRDEQKQLIDYFQKKIDENPEYRDQLTETQKNKFYSLLQAQEERRLQMAQALQKTRHLLHPLPQNITNGNGILNRSHPIDQFDRSRAQTFATSTPKGKRTEKTTTIIRSDLIDDCEQMYVNYASYQVSKMITKHTKVYEQIKKYQEEELKATPNDQELRATHEVVLTQLQEDQAEELKQLRSTLSKKRKEIMAACNEKILKVLKTTTMDANNEIIEETTTTEERPGGHETFVQSYNVDENDTLGKTMGGLLAKIIKEQAEAEEKIRAEWTEELQENPGPETDAKFEHKLKEVQLIFNKQFLDFWDAMKTEYHTTEPQQPVNETRIIERTVVDGGVQSRERTIITQKDEREKMMEEMTKIIHELLLVQTKRVEEMEQMHALQRLKGEIENLQEKQMLEKQAMNMKNTKELNDLIERLKETIPPELPLNEPARPAEHTRTIVETNVTSPDGQTVERREVTETVSRDSFSKTLAIEEANKVIMELLKVQKKRVKDMKEQHELELQENPDSAELPEKHTHELEILTQYNIKEIEELRERLKNLIKSGGKDILRLSTKAHVQPAEAAEGRRKRVTAVDKLRAKQIIEQVQLRQQKRIEELKRQHQLELHTTHTQELKDKHIAEEKILQKYHEDEMAKIQKLVNDVIKPEGQEEGGFETLQSRLAEESSIPRNVRTPGRLPTFNDTPWINITSPYPINPEHPAEEDLAFTRGKIKFQSTQITPAQPANSDMRILKNILTVKSSSEKALRHCTCICNPHKVNPLIPKDFNDNCSCICKEMLPSSKELTEIEISEQEELQRSLRRWQIARRDIIAAMSCGKGYKTGK